ncbi:hypothetical protein C2E23DRAFT_442489 [Lenzites betulinus]|nr:hypothetical protein C2E23DRAFT_442489 [Lenzites betulinus]
MCEEQHCGSFHRGCGHFVLMYQSGITFDCNSPTCALSAAHMHPGSRTCGCNRTYTPRNRVLNLIQEPCDTCKTNALAAHIAKYR